MPFYLFHHSPELLPHDTIKRLNIGERRQIAGYLWLAGRQDGVRTWRGGGNIIGIGFVITLQAIAADLT